LLTYLWLALLLVFTGVPGTYFLYMRRQCSKPWNLKLDKEYFPTVSLIIPVFNEEKVVFLKLENSIRLDYPRDKIELVLANDSSTDGTLEQVCEFQRLNPNANIRIVNGLRRRGKIEILNLALESITAEIVVASDVDCFLPSNALRRAINFLSNDSVGAVTGLELLLNPSNSWVTETETYYNDSVHTLRIGESKLHSTIIFQGGLGMYKRYLLTNFDRDVDDSGTALEILQNHSRTLLLPDATYYTMFPNTWKGKLAIKLRRAVQLIQVWLKCLKLFLNRDLALPKRIFLPEAFLHIANPLIFLFLILASFFMFFENPLIILSFFGFLLISSLSKKFRIFLVEVVQSNFVLLVALFSCISGRKITVWKAEDSSRASLTRELLGKYNLI
jgi:cellulose synthase/poly-beta-1,6-N-acetylglucosamine synthase-like glycosyltransferase